MSSARPCGSPSPMSVMTPSSARSRSAIRCAVVEPYLPAPTTVTFMATAFPPGLRAPRTRSRQLGHDGVGDLAGADRGGVVAVGLHVVGDAAALPDDRGDRPLQ